MGIYFFIFLRVTIMGIEPTLSPLKISQFEVQLTHDFDWLLVSLGDSFPYATVMSQPDWYHPDPSPIHILFMSSIYRRISTITETPEKVAEKAEHVPRSHDFHETPIKIYPLVENP